MKQGRILVIAVMAVDLVLAVACMIAYFREDRICPEFRFQTDEYIYVYDYGDGEDRLLENIMAYDDRDKDISDRIVIEKITENQENSTIVVYYAVSDSAGNVAKISRVFVADLREQEGPAGEGAADTEQAMERVSEIDGALPEQTDGEGAAGGEDGSGGPEGDGGAGDGAPGTTDGPEEDAAAEDAGQAAGPAEEEPPQQEDRSGYPILTLRTQEVTIAAGTSPPWTEIIETLRDDKDDYATLYYNLSVSHFNRNQAGDYPVSLYTEDSDGNRSDTVSVTVHVRGE